MRLLILNYDMFSTYHQAHPFVPKIVDCAGVEDILFVCEKQQIIAAHPMLKKDELYCPDDISNSIATHVELWTSLQNGNPVRIAWRPTGGIHSTDIFPMELIPSSVVV